MCVAFELSELSMQLKPHNTTNHNTTNLNSYNSIHQVNQVVKLWHWNVCISVHCRLGRVMSGGAGVLV